MKTKWHIKDLIDLEYFLHIDAENADQSSRLDIDARDRGIFLKKIQPRIPKTKSYPRRFIIKSWLDQRREMEIGTTGAKAVLPGEAFAETSRLLGYGLFFLGSLSGIGLAFSILTYTGTAPLNISVYLGTTVFAQILLVLLMGGLLLIRLIRPRLFYTSVIYSILSRLVITLSGKLKQRVMTSLSGGRREGLSAVLGLVRGKKQIYGSLFYWPIFILAQLFGIGFNLGVLGATLLRVLGTDMAFGWQSTLQVSAGVVHSIVKWLAAPWAWFVPPELAHPTLAQIEGSRLVLKDGIYHLATPDLVAWWPFLCLAVLFYGLLPRIGLFFFGLTTQRYLLDKTELTHGACDQLVDRMLTPQVQFGVQFGTSVESRPDTTRVVVPEEISAEKKNTITEKRFIVLIPDDIFEVCSDEDLVMTIGQTLGGRVAEKIRIDQGDTDEIIAADRLSAVGSKNGWTHILILQEAWQPPIIEDLAFIKALRHHFGERAPILIGLIGKPKSETIFTRVTPINWRTWKEKLATLGDPYLRLERLVHGDF
ncbi:MAG: DUF2868 domain-containing protein [Thermodesulfobacteriota bacterium]|nr:DUF2868 domain-containing protein [Thermodesulfobacteriota bacterium]